MIMIKIVPCFHITYGMYFKLHFAYKLVFCSKRPSPVTFIVAPCIMESIYCSLTNKCTFSKLGKFNLH